MGFYEPAEAPAPATSRIEFPVVFRGYDRRTVDEYMEDVTRLIEELEGSRTPEAEVKRALDRVGEQTSGILQRAREAERTITERSRAQADERLRAAERDSRSMREQAEAKVRELDEDTEVLWQERYRLLEDVKRLSGRLEQVFAAANRRYPPAEPARPGSGHAKTDPEVTQDGPALLDADPPLPENAPCDEETPTGEDAPFGEVPEWEGDPDGRDRPDETGDHALGGDPEGELWEPPAAEMPIEAYRIEPSEGEDLDREAASAPEIEQPSGHGRSPRFSHGRAPLFERLRPARNDPR